jgi:hypothetical protein
MTLTANNASTPLSSTLTGTGLGIGTTAPTHSLTIPSVGTGLSVYNTSDQTTNYERLRIAASSNTYAFINEASGTGTVRDIVIGNTKTITVKNGQLSGGSIMFSTGLSVANTAGVGLVGSMAASSGLNTVLSIAPTINQSSTAGYTALSINPTETATGSGVKKLIDAQVGGSSKFAVDNAGKVTTVGGIVPRTSTEVSSATPTINTDTSEYHEITALATNITSFTTNLTGTPGRGQKLWIAIIPTATRAITATLPVSITTRTDVGFIWNVAASKWRCMAAG